MADFCKLLMGGCPPSPPQGKAKTCAKRVNKNELCWQKKKKKKKVNYYVTTIHLAVKLSQITHIFCVLIAVISKDNNQIIQAQKLVGEITLSELAQALKTMKNNKTPGIDGFPSEFFKVF